MSDSVRPHRGQPIKLHRPWDSPGKNTGAGCHFLLQCMKVKSESEVAQSCLTLSNPMDCSPPGSSIHGIFQARVLERGATAFSDFQLSTRNWQTFPIKGQRVNKYFRLCWSHMVSLPHVILLFICFLQSSKMLKPFLAHRQYKIRLQPVTSSFQTPAVDHYLTQPMVLLFSFYVLSFQKTTQLSFIYS